MSPKQIAWFCGLFAAMLSPQSTETVSEYCEREISFNEPGCTGKFSFAGREYLREPLDNWGRDEVTDQQTVFATRTGKTRIVYGGIAWTLKHRTARLLCVKPTMKGPAGAESDVRTRFIPMLRASRDLAVMIPSGAKRHEFKTAQQVIGGSIIDWTGSNSVANLAGNPARVVVQDEVDKFGVTRKRDPDGNVVEADASSLADERCKEFSNPKRFKSSTPTLASGRIWDELLKSDLRRYFVPCPHCSKHVVFAWSKQYTVLPKLGCEAYVKWDSLAKVAGEWDYAKVEATAHAECPHCHGKIIDAHKTKMVRAGEWRATKKGAPGYRGYHLPAMYCAHRECNFGRMAVRFLKAKKGVTGLQGFINSDLAEPYMHQEVSVERTEMIAQIEVTAEWQVQMTIDCQQKAPYFWFVKRAWGGKESHGVEAGSVDQWDEIEALQRKGGIHNLRVMVDSGFGAKDDAEVYRQCATHGEVVEGQQDQLPICMGWIPAKGFPSRQRWKNDKGIYLPWRYQITDPFMGTDKAGKVRIELFEFAADFFKDILVNMRAGKGLIKWSVPKSMATDLYWKHMDGQVKKERVNKMTNLVTLKWEKRHRHWPDHIYACEVMQVAFASALNIIELETEERK